MSTVTTQARSRSAYICAAILICLGGSLGSGLETASATDLTIGTAGDDNTDQPVGVFVAWYADNSCRLRIGTSESVGVTSIDVDMDEAGARTLINCDIPTGQRLTLMTRGDGLTLGERQSLTQPAEIDSAVNSALAWVTRVGEVSERFVPDEIAARRFVVDGHVMIRSTPGVDTVDSAPHISKRAFADVIGSLEPLLKSPPEPPPEPSPEPLIEPSSEPTSTNEPTMESDTESDEVGQPPSADVNGAAPGPRAQVAARPGANTNLRNTH